LSSTVSFFFNLEHVLKTERLTVRASTLTVKKPFLSFPFSNPTAQETEQNSQGRSQPNSADKIGTEKPYQEKDHDVAEGRTVSLPECGVCRGDRGH
jgi:hypothetical protein